MELTFEENLLKVNTPKEICSSVRNRVDYRSDVGDEWATGNETWEREYGDCENMATTVSEICFEKGIKTEMFVLYPENEREGHVVVVGLLDGKLWFSSNGWFDKASSMSDIKKKIAHEFRWKDKNIVIDFFRSKNEVGITNFEVALKSLF